MEARTDEDGFREWAAQRGLLSRQGPDELRELRQCRERVSCLEQAVAYIARRIAAGDNAISTHDALTDYRERLGDAYAVLVNLASQTP